MKEPQLKRTSPGVLSTFNGFCTWAECTPEERRQLAVHLATYRAARTIEELAHEHLPAAA